MALTESSEGFAPQGRQELLRGQGAQGLREAWDGLGLGFRV